MFFIPRLKIIRQMWHEMISLRWIFPEIKFHSLVWHCFLHRVL